MNSNNTSVKIIISDICKKYINGEEPKEVLKKLNFSANIGEIVALLGKSGSGKSTILKLLSGLETPDKGTIKYILHDGTEGSPNSLRKQNHIGIAFQESALLPWKRVGENIVLPLKIKEEAQFNFFTNEKFEPELQKVLSLIGLSEHINKFPSELSGGMSQRVALARALISKPKLLLLDEPLSALDEILKRELMFDLSRILRKSSITTVIVTHSIEEAVFLCDKILILGNKKSRSQQDEPACIINEHKINVPQKMERNKEWYSSPLFNEQCNLILGTLESATVKNYE